MIHEQQPIQHDEHCWMLCAGHDCWITKIEDGVLHLEPRDIFSLGFKTDMQVPLSSIDIESYCDAAVRLMKFAFRRAHA